KRTSIDEYRVQGRGGLGIRVAKLPDDRGHLVGAAVVEETDEILVVMEKGRVVRSRVAEIPPKGRSTMGDTFAKPDQSDHIILVTTSAETEEDVENAENTDGAEGIAGAEAPAGAESSEGARSAAETDPVESAETAESDDFVESAAPDSSAQPDALGSNASVQTPTGDAPNEEWSVATSTSRASTTQSDPASNLPPADEETPTVPATPGSGRGSASRRAGRSPAKPTSASSPAEGERRGS